MLGLYLNRQSEKHGNSYQRAVKKEKVKAKSLILKSLTVMENRRDIERKGQRKVKKTFFWIKMSKMSQLFGEIPANKPKEEHSH